MANNIPAAKRVYTRLEFSLEHEEELIDFVKLNPALFNPKNPHYKNKMFRDRLWQDIADKLKKNGNCFSCIVHVVQLQSDRIYY